MRAISDEQWERLLRTRATCPEAVEAAYARRRRPTSLVSDRGTIFLVAADHPARRALGSGRVLRAAGSPMLVAESA